jgi:hypothetical protein
MSRRYLTNGTYSFGDDAPTPTPAPTLRDRLNSEPVSTAAAVALVYHGYRRTDSIVWALIYGLAGRLVPTVATPIALAQGFAKKKECK